MQDWWFEERVLGPARRLISATEVGAEASDPVAVEAMGMAIEGCFRSDVADSYAGWPPGCTTDGRSVGACVRSGERTLEVVGLMWLDFTAHVFPFRAVVTAADDSGSLAAYIGEVDTDTGAPPRLSADTLIVPLRDDAGRVVGAEMIVGRHQVPIAWTEVFHQAAT